MAAKRSKQRLFIEAAAIAEPRLSGIGHTLLETIRALCALDDFTSQYDIILLVPRSLKPQLERWNFPAGQVRIKSVGIQKHVLQILLKYRLLPPMDLLHGRGVYLFPNYKNWPLLLSRSITYVYDVAFKLFPETTQPKNLAMLQKNLAYWVKRTDLVLTISESSRQEVIKQLGLPSEKVGLVYCGIDPEEFKPQPEPAVKKVKSRYGINGDYVLFVGNIEPRKNLQRLLEAYDKLPESITGSFGLVLIGGGGWLNEDTLGTIKAMQSAGYNIIHPSQYVPDEDLPALYSGASLLVHPAIHEGFGLPPLQAMACGVPVAVSNLPVMHEILGSDAAYFEPADAGSIRQTLQDLLSDPKLRRRNIEAAKKRSRRYSWLNSARQLAGYVQEASKA